MKSIHFLSAAGLALLFSASGIQAQERTLDQQVQHRLERMTEKFGLDKAQAEKLKVWLTADETRKAEERKAREARKADQRKQLEGIFTPEQLAKLDAEKSKAHGKHKHCKHEAH